MLPFAPHSHPHLHPCLCHPAVQQPAWTKKKHSSHTNYLQNLKIQPSWASPPEKHHHLARKAITVEREHSLVFSNSTTGFTQVSQQQTVRKWTKSDQILQKKKKQKFRASRGTSSSSKILFLTFRFLFGFNRFFVNEKNCPSGWVRFGDFGDWLRKVNTLDLLEEADHQHESPPDWWMKKNTCQTPCTSNNICFMLLYSAKFSQAHLIHVCSNSSTSNGSNLSCTPLKKDCSPTAARWQTSQNPLPKEQ